MMYDAESQTTRRRMQDDEIMDYPTTQKMKSPRASLWLSFFICSIVTLGSSIEAMESHASDGVMHSQNWAVACSVITFLVTTTVVTMHGWNRCSVLIVGTRLEGFCIVCLVLFWMAEVAVISDADNGLAVTPTGGVAFGNLYYFSWGGLVNAVLLASSWLRSYYHVDLVGELRSRSPRISLWSALAVTTFVVMGSSASVYDVRCGLINSDPQYCNRTLLALVLGSVGAVVSVVLVGLKIVLTETPLGIEAGAAFLLFLSYAFGVAYVTSEKGPGAPLGNLYYSTWASFVESFVICVGCGEEWRERVEAKNDDDRTRNDGDRSQQQQSESERMIGEYGDDFGDHEDGYEDGEEYELAYDR